MLELKPAKARREFPVLSRRTFDPYFPFFGGGLLDWIPMRSLVEEPGLFAPPVEVTEVDGKIKIALEIPGVKAEDVKVEVVDGALAIEGERKYEAKEKEDGYFRSERKYGHFFRSMPLPETAAINEIKAELKNGVLEVFVPVTGKANVNRYAIPVKESKAAAHTPS